mgnify:CR=1 FL=1
MELPQDFKYSKEHTWIQLQSDGEALIGITEFAQSELGEIVYVDLPNVGASYKKDEIFGSVEAVKTTSDLYMPVSGEVLQVNGALRDDPTLVNTASFTGGWMIKIKLTDDTELQSLYDGVRYQALVG